MVYGFGIAGFISGFILGQVLLMYLLRNRSNNELLKNRDLRLRYGLFNWAVAGASSYLFIVFYRLVLASPGIQP